MATATVTVPIDVVKVFKQIATDTGSAGAALTTISTSITKCLKSLNAVVPVAGGASVTASSSSTAASSATVTSIPVNLLLNLADENSTGIAQCRMVNDKVENKSLPEANKNQLWFNHELKFTKDALGVITLDSEKTIAVNGATFLTAATATASSSSSSSASSSSSSSSSSSTKNKAEITIQDEIIKNIIVALATVKGAKPIIQPVYLQFDAATASSTTAMKSPWSQVDAAAADQKTTIEITPDVDIGTKSNIISYKLSFADEIRFANGATDLKFMDSKTNFIPDEDTIFKMNGALNPINITLLGGGKKKRQSRKSRKYTKKLSKGGKRSKKSRRF